MPPERRTTSWSTDHDFLYDYTHTEGPHGSPDPFECWFLEALARDAKQVLEVGTWKGRSAVFLSRGLPNGGCLTCVDWFQGDSTGGGGASYEGTLETFRKLGVRARLLSQDMLTTDWLALFPNRDVDLVFYDSDHRSQPQTACLRALHPVLVPHCRVVIHDAKFPEVIESMDQLCRDGLYRRAVFVDVWEGLEVLQKNP